MDKPYPSVDLHPQLLRDAFDVLDRYSVSIAKRDVVKSLNENRSELLRRVRAAIEPLISKGNTRQDDVAQIAQRIDAVLAAESSGAPGDEPRKSYRPFRPRSEIDGAPSSPSRS
jgi:hypothetical protein